MRQEAINDSGMIVVEPGDERSQVLSALARPGSSSVIVVLPDDAVFRRPGDLRELEQVASQANVALILIIAGERLRLWARSQGFNAFSSLEAWAKAASAAALTPATLNRPMNSGQFKVPGVPIPRQVPRVTGPLYPRPLTPAYGAITRQLQGEAPQRNGDMHPLEIEFSNTTMDIQRNEDVDIRPMDTPIDTPVDIQLIDVQRALQQQMAAENVQDRLMQPLSLLSSASPAPTMKEETQVQPAPAALSARSTARATRGIWHDRLLFILVALLVLGIMGGVSFGYLLSLAHSVPGTLPSAAFPYPGIPGYAGLM